MNVQFEKPKNEFPRTMVKAIVWVLLAAAFGCILGDSVQAYLGTNMDYEVSNRYTERMNAAVTWFADDMVPLTDENGQTLTDENGDPVLGVFFQRVGQALTGQDGVKILRSASGNPVDATSGSPLPVDQVYDADLCAYLQELFQVPDCFSDNIDTMTGEPIDDILLYNIAVEGDIVYFYIYYDEYGYMAITYDPTQSLSENRDVMELSSAPGWYIVFFYET